MTKLVGLKPITIVFLDVNSWYVSEVWGEAILVVYKPDIFSWQPPWLCYASLSISDKFLGNKFMVSEFSQLKVFLCASTLCS